MPIKIFFCYAHEDKKLQRKLKNHLKPLEREGLIEMWDDGDIRVGEEWEITIREQLNTAEIILLLVSPDFMASDYCYLHEMEHAIERHECGEARVIPIILHRAAWEKSPIGKLQVLPEEGKPVVGPGWRNQNEALFHIQERFRTIIEEMAKQAVEEPPTEMQTAVLPAHMQIGRTHQSPLVGREQEIERLFQLLQITEQTESLRLAGQKKSSSSLLTPMNFDTQRSPQCVVLIGDVGIGKTRLAEEAAREAKRRSWAVAWGRAYGQESNMPYRLWIQTLRGTMTQGLWQRQEVTRRPQVYLPLCSLLPELQDLLPQSSQVLPSPPEQEQLLLWESICALLSMISENTILLIVLDDLQWADRSSCELLTYLVHQMRGQPVMFLCTCRDTDVPQGHHLRPLLTGLHREQGVELIEVGPLNNEQICKLISYVTPAMAESISARASGNPFFAEELAYGVVSGNLGASDLNDLDMLPGTISAALDMRLARIGNECRRLLERGAVLGDSFKFETICAMASNGVAVDEDKVLDRLEEAVQARILAEEGNGQNITYHFWHPLLPMHLYGHLSAARRAHHHRRAAEVLQTAYANREAEGAAEIVRHLINGEATASMIAQYAGLAADHTYSLADYREAEKHYRMVVEYVGALSPAASQEECLYYAYVLEQLGECTMTQGKFEEARQFYEQVLDTHGKRLVFETEEEKRYEAQLQALFLCEIGRTWQYAGNSEERRVHFNQAEDSLFQAGVREGPAWIRVRYLQSYFLWFEGKYEEAHQHTLEALKLFENVLQEQTSASGFPHSTYTTRTLAGDPVDLGKAYALLGLVETSLGRSISAPHHLNTALAIYESHNCQREIAVVCTNQGDLYLKKSEYALAKTALHRAIGIAEKIGDIPSIVICVANLGMRSMRLGDLVEAEAFYGQALTLAEQVNDPFYICLFYGALTIILQEQGKTNEARKSLAKSLKISRYIQNATCLAYSLLTLGNFYVVKYINEEKQGNEIASHKHILLLAQARSLLTRALLFKELEAETRIEGQLALAEVTWLSGDLETAYQQASRLSDEAQECELIWLVASAQRLIGRLLATQGRQSEAEKYFQQALATFERTNMRLEHARTLQAYGISLLQNSSAIYHRLGRKYLEEVHKVFQQCHAYLEQQSTERLLAKFSQDL